MNQYYAAAAAAAAANPNMSPASAISLIQAAMTPPPALQGMWTNNVSLLMKTAPVNHWQELRADITIYFLMFK